MTPRRAWFRLRFFVSDAWDEWRHSPGVNLLALATLGTTLFIAGLVMLVLTNVERRVERLREDVRLQVFLADEISPADRDALRDDLAASPGVARVEYVDKDEALRRYRAWAGSTAALVDELRENPLPASLEVFLVAGGDAEERGAAIFNAVSRRPGVEEVRFDRELLRRLESLLDLARAGGTGLMVLVFGAVIFVMASVLRLAVYARRTEIDIMLLVGATPAFIRGPFLVAGAAQGVLSSALALVAVEAVRRFVLSSGRDGSAALVDLVAAAPLPLQAAALLAGAGLAVSLAGSWFAVRRSV